MSRITTFFQARQLTRARVILALLIAVAADGLQIPANAFAWAFLPEIIDVIAMALTIWTLGFHFLLLPTFVVEFIPVVDMLPTWTGCVLAVIALRRRQPTETPPTSAPGSQPPRLGPPK